MGGADSVFPPPVAVAVAVDFAVGTGTVPIPSGALDATDAAGAALEIGLLVLASEPALEAVLVLPAALAITFALTVAAALALAEVDAAGAVALAVASAVGTGVLTPPGDINTTVPAVSTIVAALVGSFDPGGGPNSSVCSARSMNSRSPVFTFSINHSSTPRETMPCTSFSSYPRRRAESTTSASSGAISFCRS